MGARAKAGVELKVLRERRGRIEILILNRPRARNAIDPETTTLLARALDECEADESVWAVILTATGDRAFSAGMDLKAFAATGVEGMATEEGGFAGIVKRRFPKPLLAAVNGAAVGGGFEIVLACDLVVAAEHAGFSLPEVRRGLYAAGGALFRLPRRLPEPLAMELVLTGEPLAAGRALEMGLINRVVEARELLAATLDLAETICRASPLAVRISKEVLRRSQEMTLEEAWSLIPEMDRRILPSEDAREGARAFAEKREPRWLGR